MAAHRENGSTNPWSSVHPLGNQDGAVMAAMRAILEPRKGQLQGIGARRPLDSIMEGVAPPQNTAYEADEIGGVPGWWCRPIGAARGNDAILHIHGGWFNWGSAKAFRHLAGHIALHAGAPVFLPNYRLAPEHPFPAAIDDVRACYSGLVERGYSNIAVTGDSAGGNLALGLLAYLAANSGIAGKALVGGVAISPVTDLSLSGGAWSTRAAADPLFTKEQAAGLIHSYLAGHDFADPAASPLFADLKGLVPIRVHVGDAEVLLTDSVRFVERAIAAGVNAHLDVWEGMIHGFLGSVGPLQASGQALEKIGEFLRDRLAGER